MPMVLDIAVIVVVLVGALSFLAWGAEKLDRKRLTQGIDDDKHEHRWSKWTVVKEISIHVYPDPDEGRDLPDRIDAVLRRECVICGMPDTKTVRGT